VPDVEDADPASAHRRGAAVGTTVRLPAPDSLDLDRGISRRTAPTAVPLTARIDHSAAEIDRLAQ